MLLENFASVDARGERQIEALAWLREQSGCGLLFDISNARAADLNGACKMERWLGHLRDQPLRCHMGSYRVSEDTGDYLDSHDSDISEESSNDLHQLASNSDIISVCLEREYRKTAKNLADDLHRLRTALA